MKIEKEILEILNNSETNNNELKLIGTLDRNSYIKVNKVLESCGGKWNKKLKVHVFPTNAEERLEEILITGEVEIPKDDFDYFPTPEIVVSRLIELSELTSGMTILEPSAGQGAIAIPLKKLGYDVFCYEFSEINCNVLKEKEINFQQSDFLKVIPEKKFDRIIMNPPFSKQADIKHVLHALNFLKHTGKLISVMASSVVWRENKLTKDFRDAIFSMNGSFENLPEKSFKNSGTNVNTVILKV